MLVSGSESAITPATTLNDLPGNVVPYAAGDVIQVSGVDNDGTPINAAFTYGAANDSVHDAAHLRFVNEMCNRITKLIEQYLGDDKSRPADDVVLRMILSTRADKVAEKMVHVSYRRALQNFERYDTTVFMNS